MAGNTAILSHSGMGNNSDYMVDTTAPSVDNFTMSDTELKIGDNATVTLAFSEQICPNTGSCAVTFTNADISIATLDNGTASGSLSTMTSSDNDTWTGTFTPTNNIEDDNNTLSLGTGYTDLAGNTGPDNETANYEVDTIRPVSYTHLTLPTNREV